MKKISSIAAIIIGSLLLLGSVADKALACQGVDQALSTERKQDMALKVAKAVNKDPARTEVRRFMESGRWVLVWADVPDADQGVFFFERMAGGLQFKEVWGGMAERSEIPGLMRWARGRGADFPVELARCFANAVAS